MLRKKGALNCFKRIQSTSQSKPIAPKKKINVKIKFEKKGMNPRSNQYSFGVAFPCFRMVKKICKASGIPAKDSAPDGQKGSSANASATPTEITGAFSPRRIFLFNKIYIPKKATNRISV